MSLIMSWNCMRAGTHVLVLAQYRNEWGGYITVAMSGDIDLTLNLRFGTACFIAKYHDVSSV